MQLRQYLKNDSPTIYTCLIVILLGFLALKSDFSFFNWQKNNFRANLQSIGKMTKINSDVRVRMVKNIFWTEARKNDIVGTGDSVFVGPDSTTVIRFSDGKFIVVGENSLVKFNTENQNIKLSLEYGSFKSTNLPSTIVLDDCGKSINIQSTSNADLEIGKSGCGKMKMKSSTGIVKINSRPLASNKSVRVKSSIINAPLKLKLKPVTNEAMQKLEALDPVETNKLASLSMDELQKQFASPNVAPALPARTVAAIEPAPTVVPAVKNSKPAPEIKLKNAQIKFDYQAKNSKDMPKEKGFPVQWNEIPNAQKYVVEVDSDSKFTSPQEFVTRKPSSVVQVPGAGKYNFRVSAYDAENRKISSTEKNGEILYNRIFNSITPLIDEDYEAMTYFFQKSAGKYISLKWLSDVAPDRKFKIELAKDQKFKKVLGSYSTTDNSYVVEEPLPIGKYFWRVRTESTTATQVSDWSPNGFIEIIPGKLK